tara:strand:- start:437 stop:661 length:225 start_codon:yes stop_codon:yes gene_type:complete
MARELFAVCLCSSFNIMTSHGTLLVVAVSVAFALYLSTVLAFCHPAQRVSYVEVPAQEPETGNLRRRAWAPGAA